MIIYYVSCKDKEEAKRIAKELLRRRLISCANIMQSDSIYVWEGEQKDHPESILLVKTLERCEEDVKDAIRELSSYDLPAIIKIVGRANEEFLSWMESQIKQP